jgi:hypothetical protein
MQSHRLKFFRQYSTMDRKCMNKMTVFWDVIPHNVTRPLLTFEKKLPASTFRQKHKIIHGENSMNKSRGVPKP